MSEWVETLVAVAVATAAYVAALVAIELVQISRYGDAGTITHATRRLIVEYTWLGLLSLAVPCFVVGVVLLHIALGLKIEHKRDDGA